MTEKPILFNTRMVKAILDGRKTQTRRLCKGQPQDGITSPEMIGYKPSYRVGDILWVRETWNYGYFESSDRELDNSQWFEPLPLDYVGGGYLKALSHFVYRADFTEAEEFEYGMENERGERQHIAWRPSIHMPREAARLFLRVKNVRCELLQSITPEDVDAEGCKEYAYSVSTGELLPSKPTWFRIIWNETIKKADLPSYGWEANPWVWVITFERMEKE